MDLREGIKARGLVILELRDKDGNLKSLVQSNLVTYSGLAFIAGRLMDNTQASPGFIAVGTTNTPAVSAQTTLLGELVRIALASKSLGTTTVANDTVIFSGILAEGVGTGTLTEAGIFDTAGAGLMLARTVFNPVIKSANDILTITWKITFS